MELLPHPGKNPFFVRGEGASAEANVAGVMKHRMFHQSFACGEEKPWLFIGADMTPPPLSFCEQILEELRAVNAPLPPT